MNYVKGLVIKHEKDWVTDFAFDFGNVMSTVYSYTVEAALGIECAQARIENDSVVIVRVSGGVEGTKYSCKVIAVGITGEVRSMTVQFQIV